MTAEIPATRSDTCYICRDDTFVIHRKAGKWFSKNRNIFVPECGHPLHKMCFIGLIQNSQNTVNCGKCRCDLNSHIPLSSRIKHLPARINTPWVRDTVGFLTIQVVANVAYWKYNDINPDTLNLFAMAIVIYLTTYYIFLIPEGVNRVFPYVYNNPLGA
jgi:hypothetical protein